MMPAASGGKSWAVLIGHAVTRRQMTVGQGAALLRHRRQHSTGHMLHMFRLMVEKHFTFDEAHSRALRAVGR